MAEQVLFGPYLSVGGTDLSLYLEDLQINRNATLQPFVTGNPGATTGYERNLVGVQKVTVVAKFSDDLAVTKVHPVLRALFGTTFTVIAALNGSTPSTSNEVLTDTMTFADLSSGGAVGIHLEKDVTFVHASGTPVFATA